MVMEGVLCAFIGLRVSVTLLSGCGIVCEVEEIKAHQLSHSTFPAENLPYIVTPYYQFCFKKNSSNVTT